MDLRDAMTQISEIRQRMVRSQVFRGYRSATVALMGVLALVAAAFQDRCIPRGHVFAFVTYWSIIAAMCMIASGVELLVRYHRTGSSLQRNLTVLAITQFLPAILAGAGIAGILMRMAPQAAWMLPGLWAILLAMGIFASRHVLSQAMAWPAAYHLLAGLVCLSLGDGAYALHPWQMGLAFGPGELLTAAFLRWTVENDHASEE